MLRSLAKTATRVLLYGTLGAIAAFITVGVVYLNSRPDLSPWHELVLDGEFTADHHLHSFADYLAMEDRLFAQLDARIYKDTPGQQRRLIDRYSRGSLADPARWTRNWNRSFEFPIEKPRAAVLLLHGMSDSPYSLRAIGQRLHESGVHVLGLRLPGHGTLPSALTEVRWQDMAAAVQLAVAHLRMQVGERPIHLIGYSNGAALAVNYVLEGLEHPERPRVSGMVLISPAIGVTPVAALAVWQARLGRLLDMDKLQWTDIRPEYDPFKYNSFPVNAGDQVHRLTARIAALLERHRQSGALQRLPPILAFQSAVDATVSTPALVGGLFQKLSPNGHELVLFDIHRLQHLRPILRRDPTTDLGDLLRQSPLPFTATVITSSATDERIIVRRRLEDQSEIRETATHLEWPRGIYSLSHVALPFAESDPLYGADRASGSPGIRLGDLALRGEHGVLQVSAADMLRLRWNPFYDLLEQRIIEFLGLTDDSP